MGSWLGLLLCLWDFQGLRLYLNFTKRITPWHELSCVFSFFSAIHVDIKDSSNIEWMENGRTSCSKISQEFCPLTYEELSPDFLHSCLVSVADSLSEIILSVFILTWLRLQNYFFGFFVTEGSHWLSVNHCISKFSNWTSLLSSFLQTPYRSWFYSWESILWLKCKHPTVPL